MGTSLSSKTAVTSWAAADQMHVLAVGNIDRRMTLEDLFTEIPVSPVIKNSNGIDIDTTDGSDGDVDLLTCLVTGTPKLWWDESEDELVCTHNIRTLDIDTRKAATGNTIAIGAGTGPGDFCCYLGHLAGYYLPTNHNVCVGYGAGYGTYPATSHGNVCIGFNAGAHLKDTNNVVAIGLSAAADLQSGTDGTIAIGANALVHATANLNVAIGYSAMTNTTTGGGSTAIGYYACASSTTANGNVGVGQDVLHDNTGSYNTAVGTMCCDQNTSGEYNVGFGFRAAYMQETGSYNIYIGAHAADGDHVDDDGTHWSGSYNVVIGAETATNCETGFANSTLLGYRAGYALRTGANNLLIGYKVADNLTTGSNNIIIGYDVDAPAVGSANVLVIGNLLYGTGLDGTGTTLSSGNIGVGVQSPAERLQVANAVSVSNVDEGNIGRLTRRCARELVTLSGATKATTLNIPNGARLLAVQMCVNTAVTDTTGDDTWSAAFSGGSTTAIVTGAAAAKQTKINLQIVDEITSGTTNITFTPNGGSFSGGVIEVLVYYEELTAMANAA